MSSHAPVPRLDPVVSPLAHSRLHSSTEMNPSEPSSPFSGPEPGSPVPVSSLTPAQTAAAWFLRVYRYIPNEDPAIAAVVIMAVLAVVTGITTIRFKGHYMWIIAAATLLEALGFALRIGSIHQATHLGIYIGSMIFLITMPIAMAFVNYLVFGRILKEYGRKIMFLKATWIAVIFLVSDVLSFLLQGGATGLLTSKTASTVKIGRNIIIAGFVIQLVFFVAFIWLTFWAAFISPRFKLYKVKSLRQTFWGLWITIFLILLRNVYRAVEYIADEESYIPSHEWTMYVFEFAFIALAVVFYNIFHFGRTLPAKGQWNEDLKLHKSRVKSKEGTDEVQMEDVPPAPQNDQV